MKGCGFKPLRDIFRVTISFPQPARVQRYGLVIIHAFERPLKSIIANVDQAVERPMDSGYRYQRKAEEQRERKDLERV